MCRYTLEDWITFCENKLDKLTVIHLPVSHEHLGVPGSKAHCTIANAVAAYTGMDPKSCDISVDADYIKFVVNGRRYFLYQEVVGAEHIKDLDTLAFCENGDPDARKEFKPFILKLRYRVDKPLFSRPRVAKPTSAIKKEKSSAVATSSETTTTRRKRSDAEVTKSRWARKSQEIRVN